MDVDRAIFALDDKRDDDPWGPEAYYLPEVKIGERLNFTADDYEAMKELKPKAYENSSDFVYKKMKTEEAGNLLKSVIG